MNTLTKQLVKMIFIFASFTGMQVSAQETVPQLPKEFNGMPQLLFSNYQQNDVAAYTPVLDSWVNGDLSKLPVALREYYLNHAYSKITAYLFQNNYFIATKDLSYKEELKKSSVTTDSKVITKSSSELSHLLPQAFPILVWHTGFNQDDKKNYYFEVVAWEKINYSALSAFDKNLNTIMEAGDVNGLTSYMINNGYFTQK